MVRVGEYGRQRVVGDWELTKEYNMSLYQRWMQLPTSQRIFVAAFTGILAYGGMTITDYFNEQGDIERAARTLVLKEHQKINQEAAEKEKRS